ncbi:RusA family crossover junction endodeoxyribonuclease [Cupriavidus taiwanensis]|uniref:RusA family crossover junction endodeoxyribonuclease n=1 Tax=Cupriavidus taiwanensis TaxID=164546 RepID=UPI0022B267B2|nr:RusA family crossover junction endodeoxyribonuclease [Cupriavidus taiwanensis]
MPLPAPRPRVFQNRAYMPASYTAFCKEVAAALPQTDEPPLDGELKMFIEFVCKPIAKSKFTTPAGDLDNLAKGVMDVLTKEGWYGDDRQIIRLVLSKRFPEAGEVPHMKFQLCRMLPQTCRLFPLESE